MEILNKYIYDPNTDLLGKGGFATVYKAFDKVLEMPVALKFFHPQEQANKYTIINEIKRAIILAHPNIVKYYGVETLSSQNFHGQHEEVQIGVMEYVQEGQLKTYLNANSIGKDELKKLLMDILKGLHYLHNEGIIHRDIKPQNILLGRDKQGRLIAKIADFGISKAADSNQASASLLLGTIEYMAPEQFNPERYGINKKISYNVDIWAFGVTAYYLLTGELLFGSRSGDTSAAQLINKIVHAEGLDDKLQIVEEPFKSMLLRCVVPDAKQRTTDIDELIRILKGERPSSAAFEKSAGSDPATLYNTASTAIPSGTGEETMYIQESTSGNDIDATEEIRLPVTGRNIGKTQGLISDVDTDATQEIKFGSGEQGSALSEDEVTTVNEIELDEKPQRRIKPIVWFIVIIAALGSGGYFAYSSFTENTKTESSETNPSTSSADIAFREIADNLIQIPGGTFSMGSNNYEFTVPVHKVNVKTYMLSKFEVTQKQWNAIMQDGKYKDSALQEHPADNISWSDAQKFINKLNNILNVKKKGDSSLNNIAAYKLPSEAEWEYTVLTGYQGSKLSLNDISWNNNNSGQASHKIGTKAPDKWGIHDMLGNVYEWCDDWYSDSYAAAKSSDAKILRGGDFTNSVELVEVKVRNGEILDKRSKNIGFRVAASLQVNSKN